MEMKEESFTFNLGGPDKTTALDRFKFRIIKRLMPSQFTAIYEPPRPKTFDEQFEERFMRFAEKHRKDLLELLRDTSAEYPRYEDD